MAQELESGTGAMNEVLFRADEMARSLSAVLGSAVVVVPSMARRMRTLVSCIPSLVIRMASLDR